MDRDSVIELHHGIQGQSLRTNLVLNATIKSTMMMDFNLQPYQPVFLKD